MINIVLSIFYSAKSELDLMLSVSDRLIDHNPYTNY